MDTRAGLEPACRRLQLRALPVGQRVIKLVDQSGVEPAEVWCKHAPQPVAQARCNVPIRF